MADQDNLLDTIHHVACMGDHSPEASERALSIIIALCRYKEPLMLAPEINELEELTQDKLDSTDR